jgi:hypothetical protein
MLIAYHNDKKLKESVVLKMRMHKEADELVQGYGYWKDGKGCAVGCLIHSGSHVEYETRFGIPRFLARLEDGIFERLPVKEAQQWPERFLGAIQPGADLSMVFYKFMHWLLVDPQDGVLQYANTKRTKNSINKIANLYKQYIDGDLSLEQFRDAADADADAAAAYAAAAYAAAAYAAAAYAAAAADAAADAAAAACAYAADAACAAYAYAAADAADAYAADAYAADAYAAWKAQKQQATIKQADKLIELLESAPMGKAEKKVA